MIKIDTSAYELLSAALKSVLVDISYDNDQISHKVWELYSEIEDIITVKRLTNEGRLN